MAQQDIHPPRQRGRPLRTADEVKAMRQLIAQTAELLFKKEGFANVSIRRLAKEVGCSPMTLYKHYESKLAILQTLWAVVFKQLFSELDVKLEAVAVPKKRLRIACQHYTGFWIAHPEHYRLVFMADGVTQPEVSLFIDNPEIVAGFDLFYQIIGEVSDGADLDTLKLKNDLIIGALNGIAHNTITISGYPWSDPDAMIDALLDSLFLS